MTYQRQGGVYADGNDRSGTPRWRLRAVVDGVKIDERFVGTKGEARKLLRQLQADAAAGRLAARTGKTVEELFSDYIEHRISIGKLRPGKPSATHKGVVRTWIVPNLPAKVSDVKRTHVQKLVHAMIEAGRTRSTPQVKALLTGGFRYAVTMSLVSVNPCEGVGWPKVTRPDLVALSDGQVSRIVEHSNDEHRIVLALGAATGLRASELAGLRWSSVILDASPTGCPLRDAKETDHPAGAHLHVVESVQRVNGMLTRQPPKSARGRRWVPLSDGAVRMLRAYRKAQLEERRMVLGPAWHDEDVVLDAGDGRPVDPDDFGRAFRAAAKRAGVVGFRMHDLRHYFITRLVAQGI